MSASFKKSKDKFIGLRIGQFKIIERIGSGNIGKVYLAYIKDLGLKRAVKFIENPRPNWEREITKVIALGTTSGVVPYIEHGYLEVEGHNYLYIMWTYIKGSSLKELIDHNEINLPIIVDVLERVLEVLHACKQIEVEHADLHSGNILVEDVSDLNLFPEHKNIWITDFGYKSANDEDDMLDDYEGLNRIIQESINAIDFHTLDGEEKWIYSVLKQELPRWLLEINPTIDESVKDPRKILLKWNERRKGATITNGITEKSIGDYLVTEYIGDRYDEWKELFVPKFISIDDLLSNNICVLTGLRGCGKTMIFRRLTAIYDARLGPSGIPKSESYIGFYLNARFIAEAFPWLPSQHKLIAMNQVIHFFNVSWCLEIVDWLRILATNEPSADYRWISTFFSQYYQDYFATSDKNVHVLDHLKSLLNRELKRSSLNSKYKDEPWSWPLSSISFLEEFTVFLKDNLTIYTNIDIINKPFYFFLDDYSAPLVKLNIQKIINQVIFRRSSKVFFKIATESEDSFIPIGQNEKVLEQGNDFLLIDISSKALQVSDKECADILSSILGPRIERNKILSNRNLTLENILGRTPYNNIELARMIRGESPKKEVVYHGIQVFYDLWSSDIREAIQIFAQMVNAEVPKRLSETHSDGIINSEIQNRILKETGGKFLNTIEAATNPTNKNYKYSHKDTYGKHLIDIAKTFQEIALYDLRNKDSENPGRLTAPKQARRIELKNIKGELPKKVNDYYIGLNRYGLFIRDNRAKSAQGTIAKRLYLRGVLIPFFRLTFSKRDSITMTWSEFCKFLEQPEEFKKYYINKDSKKHRDNSEQLNFPWGDDDD